MDFPTDFRKQSIQPSSRLETLAIGVEPKQNQQKNEIGKITSEETSRTQDIDEYLTKKLSVEIISKNPSRAQLDQVKITDYSDVGEILDQKLTTFVIPQVFDQFSVMPKSVMKKKKLILPELVSHRHSKPDLSITNSQKPQLDLTIRNEVKMFEKTVQTKTVRSSTNKKIENSINFSIFEKKKLIDQLNQAIKYDVSLENHIRTQSLQIKGKQPEKSEDPYQMNKELNKDLRETNDEIQLREMKKFKTNKQVHSLSSRSILKTPSEKWRYSPEHVRSNTVVKIQTHDIDSKLRQLNQLKSQRQLRDLQLSEPQPRVQLYGKRKILKSYLGQKRASEGQLNEPLMIKNNHLNSEANFVLNKNSSIQSLSLRVKPSLKVESQKATLMTDLSQTKPKAKQKSFNTQILIDELYKTPQVVQTKYIFPKSNSSQLMQQYSEQSKINKKMTKDIDEIRHMLFQKSQKQKKDPQIKFQHIFKDINQYRNYKFFENENIKMQINLIEQIKEKVDKISFLEQQDPILKRFIGQNYELLTGISKPIEMDKTVNQITHSDFSYFDHCQETYQDTRKLMKNYQIATAHVKDGFPIIEKPKPRKQTPPWVKLSEQVPQGILRKKERIHKFKQLQYTQMKMKDSNFKLSQVKQYHQFYE